MEKWNERGAGRKKRFAEQDILEIRRRYGEGEQVSHLAAEYQVSRQTISSYLHSEQNEEKLFGTEAGWKKKNKEFAGFPVTDYTMRMEYMHDQKCCSTILIDFLHKKIQVKNYTDFPLHKAFGIKSQPDWNDFEYFLRDRCVPESRDGIREILKEMNLDFYDPLSIIEKTEGRMSEDRQWIRIYYYQKELKKHAKNPDQT